MKFNLAVSLALVSSVAASPAKRAKCGGHHENVSYNAYPLSLSTGSATAIASSSTSLAGSSTSSVTSLPGTVCTITTTAVQTTEETITTTTTPPATTVVETETETQTTTLEQSTSTHTSTETAFSTTTETNTVTSTLELTTTVVVTSPPPTSTVGAGYTAIQSGVRTGASPNKREHWARAAVLDEAGDIRTVVPGDVPICTSTATETATTTETSTITSTVAAVTPTTTSTSTTTSLSTVMNPPADATVTTTTTEPVTAAATETTTSTTVSTTTLTTTAGPTPTFYAACADPANYMSTYNGLNIAGGSLSWALALNDNLRYAESAEACCVMCHQQPGCAGSMYSGGACDMLVYKDANVCRPDAAKQGFYTTEGSGVGVVSNGGCGQWYYTGRTHSE